MKSIFKKKRDLYLKWANLYDILDSEKMDFDKYIEARKLEKKYYDEWKFLKNFTKAKEKIENEKKKN